MSNSVRRDDEKLIAVGATLLFFCNELGLLHYNKLVYLFEYFYIKNFGKRFTGEVFLKLNHGPVIVGYKKHLQHLIETGIAEGDVSELKENRQVDETFYPKVRIATTKKTAKYVISDGLLVPFTRNLCARYATLSAKEIEHVAYSTPPMKAFLRSPRKHDGSYILRAECIRMSEYANPLTEGRRRALKHLQEYPEIDYEQQRRLAEELSDLSKLRPTA